MIRNPSGLTFLDWLAAAGKIDMRGKPTQNPNQFRDDWEADVDSSEILKNASNSQKA